ncbi:MAG TPA: serine peptidase, partial [Telluria sp.]
MTRKSASTIMSALLLAAASLSLGTGAGAAVPVSAPLVSGLPDFTDLIEKAGPAVVNIRTTEKAR